MKRNLIRAACLAAAILDVFIAAAQLHDDFSDGDFSSNPTWTGNASDWIVNTSQRLQSNSTTTNSSFYLSTASHLVAGAQWELSVQLQFNTSSNNYVDIWLTASAADISKSSTTGYFVRLGNTDDDICLYRRDTGGISTRLIDGLDGTLNSSNNTLKLKVVCDAAHHWVLYRDLSATGNNYISEGNATDSVYGSSSFFGILVKQSTSGFFQKHFFDDIDISPYTPDTTPPGLLGATATDTSALDLLFSEAVDAATAQAAGNYFADNGIGFPVSAKQDAVNRSLVHLAFNRRFPNGASCKLSVSQVKDLAGNAMPGSNIVFSYYTVQPFDILIDEIMADPSPVVGLPPYEYIELKNVSPQLLDLYGWKVCDSTACATIGTHVLLGPDSFLIVTSASAASSLAGYGSTLSVSSFPTLNNDGDLLYLRSREGRIIHAVSYNMGWYRNDIKSKGGWSLEMIDTQLPCVGAANWRASNTPDGGTPGKKNSVQAVNKDTDPPVLRRATASDNSNILLYFDEPLDSTQASMPAHYIIDKGIGTAATASVQPPLFDKVLLTTALPLSAGTVYTITANGIADCMGNTISGFNTTRTGIASTPDSLDVVINEILFNPLTGGTDYVELYNRSNRIVNLKNMYICNRSSSGQSGTEKAMSSDDRLLLPGDFIVLTEDPVIVRQQYLCKNPDAFSIVSSMPSFPDDKGDVIILNSRGQVLDELAYNAQWHFRLISNPAGVSLERISTEAATQNAANWHSAAGSVGYGTPTYQNSQAAIDPVQEDVLSITPMVFSPDNDGYDDVATLSYHFPAQGYVCNITIYDAAGRVVKRLANNVLCGIRGSFRWDGLDDRGKVLPVGVYVVYMEAFSADGKTSHRKQALTLARKM